MESTTGILWKGYPYFMEKFEEKDTDVIETRLFLHKTFVLRGKEAAELFYDQSKFKRKKATPKRFQKTLFGEGGVQGMDGKPHMHRKQLFMKYMKPHSIDHIAEIFEKYWNAALQEWKTKEEVNLFHESEKILMRTACEWTSVPLPERDVEKRTKQMSEMIDGSGGVGIRHYKGRIARDKAEEWMEGIIEDVRKKRMKADESTILYGFSMQRNIEGKRLSKQAVAVEMLNLLRPIVAIARYIVFAAHALYEHPEYHNKLKKQEDAELTIQFAQEVRRYYPFFPFVAAIVKRTFTWNGIRFKKGRRTLLDLYATNHDRHLWKNPGEFYPERFQDHKENPYDFIPQGGGDFHHNHRCAGEWITIRLLEKSIDFMTKKMKYEVPEQDMEIDLSRIPAIPESRFRIRVY